MTLRVDIEAMGAESARLDGVADTMRERVDAAQRTVGDLLSAGWTGTSATAFRGSFDEWESAASEAVERLRSLVEELRASARDYAAVEQASGEVVAQLEAEIPSAGIARILGGGDGGA